MHSRGEWENHEDALEEVGRSDMGGGLGARAVAEVVADGVGNVDVAVEADVVNDAVSKDNGAGDERTCTVRALDQ